MAGNLNYGYLSEEENTSLNLTGGVMEGNIDMNYFSLMNLPTPTQDRQAVPLALLNAVIPLGVIVMWSGKTIPLLWSLCEGTNRTPNLTDRFIISKDLINIGQTGGKSQQTLTINK